MKLVTYRDKGFKFARAGIQTDQGILPLSQALERIGEDPGLGSSVVTYIQLPWETQKRIEAIAKEDFPKENLTSVDKVDLLAPIPHPSKVLGVAFNYYELCKYRDVKPPSDPVFFAKLPTSVVGPSDTVVVPSVIDKVDYEAELGVIIGRSCRRISADQVPSYIAGYTLVNDVTAKFVPGTTEAAPNVLIELKGADTFAPTGTHLITLEDVPAYKELTIKCSVNGDKRQEFSPSDMIFPIPDLIACLTKRFTLCPGDLILTGTSVGVGITQEPPVFLNNGDVVECTIEGYTSIRNEFLFE
jgi:2-keto-4-pentenoate hydratase/2-oxohepta-3-ene-1,7-dioic acid hydratase in catechol pathway